MILIVLMVSKGLTLLEFFQNKFTDSYGNYYSDLSENAQNKLKNYNKFAYGEIDQNAPDKDVIRTFLTLNFTGEPISPEHLEYVRSIKF